MIMIPFLQVDGIICSFDEAIPQLIFFQKKSAGSANWNTVLDIGPDFQIAITGKIKVWLHSQIAVEQSLMGCQPQSGLIERMLI